MKKVIFDVDGVLLSEERYFDVSGLTVWEWLYSPKYMGLPSERNDFDPRRVSEGQIAAIRRKVWLDDELMHWLKSMGINSNWDMVHADLITIIWLMAETYRTRTGGEVLHIDFHTEKDIKNAGLLMMGLPVPKAKDVLAKWKEIVPADTRGDDVIRCIAKSMEPAFGGPVEWAGIRSDFYRLHTEAFQAWYLGDDVFISYYGRLPYSGGKEGFLTRETPLASASTIKELFQTLKEKGFSIAVATGRSRREAEIPFRTHGWWDEFDENYFATATDAWEVSSAMGGLFLDKPHPFLYLCAIFGRKKENYLAYIRGEYKIKEDDEIYVVGDSYSDILGGRAAGAKVIGVLTGLEGKAAAAIFKENGVPYVHRVTDIGSILFQ